VAASRDPGLLGEQLTAIGPLSLEYLDPADTRASNHAIDPYNEILQGELP